MCANYKPATLAQIADLNLPEIPFSYPEEIYPSFQTPLLFKSALGLEWRLVNFGLIPKWAESRDVAKRTYNARNETLLEKASFREALLKCKFGLIPVTEFYEAKYINGKAQRWGVKRKDGQAFFIAALYEITKINGEIIRSACMLTMDAIDHAMMKEFHEPGNIKRSIIVIAQQHIEQWVSWKNINIAPFIKGFPVDEFECFYCPQQRQAKNSPQLSMFDE
ncbi:MULTISPECIES: SOS response-associated peptidase family protein [unclassified Acinetobacter]|uniref:SOS response-associated peptidase family protein n=1 Tax=unclassified Acinetobacter TaxID=196816 RepID=UPI0025752267|nr:MULTISPECIES: SOS response-associated peptidase family protein [unclassified Acinetobacter]MDM1756529.1 SOS response-associated peptidase family protein [Acinetobacter sp. 256-1]MDM1759745.1 SOS response-associated peptidase family protein [Acinetobacter sp. 251-1]